MTSTPLEPSLKDKVFEICENLHSKNKKINRDIVREQLGGGSFSDISPLVAEWRKLKKLESVQSDSDINSMVRAGAEKAVGTLMAQEAIATHFYQNPDQLPSDLKAQLEGARGNFTQSRSNTNKAAYNPQNLINLAMQKIKETQRKDGLELIG
ncbi:MAG: DNA-binding protein [Dolichospermum sp. BR01]|nr:DNA-binding protein [Dolichospermum sp. BR01]